VTLAATAALTALTAASPADAAPRQTPPEQTTEAAAPRHAGEPIMAIVSIKSQKVTIYDADGWVLRAPKCAVLSVLRVSGGGDSQCTAVFYTSSAPTVGHASRFGIQFF